MNDNKNKSTNDSPKKKITRKEALKKGGKYAAVTAASMFIILSPKESQATSPGSPSPPSGW